ncbi:lytic transglycosylase domain-containing protein [Paenibacillus gansuensis]|uniref:Lytic transglycosylase domain-containing protein n=1 Tax=Paenibacillus gansuensis TaxID=306542 RepID=A0ABW5PE74_9BACL
MSIDAKMISEMLKLQLRSMDYTNGTVASPTNAAETSEFTALLQQLMSPEGKLPSEGTLDSLKAYFAPVPNPLLFVGETEVSSAEHLVSNMQSGELRTSPLEAGAKETAYNTLIQGAASRYGVSESLVKAVIRSESSFDPDVVSSAGAKGLMQLMDGTAESLGVTNSFDPAQNIDGGTKYLADLLRKYDGNTAVAVAAYNCGPGRIDRLGIHNDADLFASFDKLPGETQKYVTKVLRAKQEYMI